MIKNIDCLIGMKELKDNSVDLIIADFPYYRIKGGFDFIWKDFNEFLAWVEKCAVEFERILKDNGSLYVYGHAKKIAYKQIIFDKYFNLESSLVWEKMNCQTKKYIDKFRCYAPITERLLFYSKEIEKTGLEKITEEHIKPQNPFAKYLRGEFKRAGVTKKEISKLFPSATGGLTGRVSNWLNGDNIISKKQYLKIREHLNNKYLRQEYKYLKQEYEHLRQKYEHLRRPFNNIYKNTDVLKYSQESNITQKYDHPTQKPPKLSRALIETSSKEGDLVCIPFVGSGVEIEACEQLKRKYIGFEIDKKYCKTAKARLDKAQGKVGLFK